MKRNKKSKASRKRGGMTRTQDLSGPVPSNLRYDGPVHVNPPRPIVERSVQVLNYDTIQMTTAGGTYAFAVGAGSSSGSVTLSANALEWSQFSAQFSDYRVLGMRVEFCPALEGAVLPTDTTTATFYTATDIDDATPPTVYGDLASFNTMKMHPCNKRWWREVSLLGRSGEGDLSPVATAFTKFQSVKVIMNAAQVSRSYGRIHVYWRVQFYHRE